MAAHHLNLHLSVFIIGLLIIVGHVSAVTTSDQNKNFFYRRFEEMIFNMKKVGGGTGGNNNANVFGGSLHLVPNGPDALHH
ncbi:hypothetical protein Csa_000151 [Cucumis sativus]|uniref:Transmembrane protein n=1 Tax=Cucumis sativus TaxID=3659 RepID=A0A0A0KKB3_CUCSA|nr:hypothetical protein Csa_000151 [Cucumis sativus]